MFVGESSVAKALNDLSLWSASSFFSWLASELYQDLLAVKYVLSQQCLAFLFSMMRLGICIGNAGMSFGLLLGGVDL